MPVDYADPHNRIPKEVKTYFENDGLDQEGLTSTLAHIISYHSLCLVLKQIEPSPKALCKTSNRPERKSTDRLGVGIHVLTLQKWTFLGLLKNTSVSSSNPNCNGSEGSSIDPTRKMERAISVGSQKANGSE